MSAGAILWFVLMGVTFAIWAGMFFVILFKLLAERNAIRAAEGRNPLTDVPGVLRSYRDFFVAEGWRWHRMTMLKLTLALFGLMATRLIFLGG